MNFPEIYWTVTIVHNINTNNMLITKIYMNLHFLWEIHKEMEYSENTHVISKENLDKGHVYH